MLYLPRFQHISEEAKLAEYSVAYESCSGLPIPQHYLDSTNNRVFAIYWKQNLVGGFILGADTSFRTLQCFAQSANHPDLLNRMGAAEQYSEICCFFIAKAYRTHSRLNLFIWLALTFAIRRFGRKKLLFGTNSPSLAKLYGQTHHSMPFHQGRINSKRIFLFLATRRQSVQGMLEIIRHKLKRRRRIKRSSASRSLA